MSSVLDAAVTLAASLLRDGVYVPEAVTRAAERYGVDRDQVHRAMSARGGRVSGRTRSKAAGGKDVPARRVSAWWAR